MDLLEITEDAGESGPVIRLRGEADSTNAGRLREVLGVHAEGAAGVVTIDLSGLRFADTAVVHAFITADRAMRKRGGVLVLAGVGPAVGKTLSLLGVDRVLMIRSGVGGAGPARA